MWLIQRGEERNVDNSVDSRRGVGNGDNDDRELFPSLLQYP